MTDMDHAIVAGTARLVVGLYFLALLLGVSNRARCENLTSLRLWTAGCFALVVHVLAAFQWAHHWSWVEAVTHTTQATERLIGTSTGAELAVNFVFATWWVADCAARWRARCQQRHMARAYNSVVHFVWAFMFFNATVVFGPSYWRWLTGPAVLLLLVEWNRRRASDAEPKSQ